MSVSYLVTLIEPKNLEWRIPLAAFEEALQSRWPHALIEDITPKNEHFCREWEWRTPNGIFSGCLYNHLSAVSLRGVPEDCAEFVEWFRQQVPEDLPLLMADSSSGRLMPIHAGITSEEVLNGYWRDD